MWPVVWLIAVLVTATSLPSNCLASKNAISACESDYCCVNIIILVVNTITSAVLSNGLCSVSQERNRILHCNAGYLLNILQ